ncbi:MAG: corrinoid protein [Thermodesulfobacteriota bacterium]
MTTPDDIRTALISLDMAGVQRHIQQGLAEGLSPATLLEEGLIAGMNTIGTRFKEGELFMPEVLVAAKAMHTGLELLKPLLTGGDHSKRGTVVIGTVKGDLHDIGKNLVIMMLQGAGFTVIDLGVDVPPEQFIKAIETHHPQVVGLSALLTTTMPQLERTIQQLAPYRRSLHIVVGGAPITQRYADAVGADGYAPDGASAVDKIRQLTTGKQ